MIGVRNERPPAIQARGNQSFLERNRFAMATTLAAAVAMFGAVEANAANHDSASTPNAVTQSANSFNFNTFSPLVRNSLTSQQFTSDKCGVQTKNPANLSFQWYGHGPKHHNISAAMTNRLHIRTIDGDTLDKTIKRDFRVANLAKPANLADKGCGFNNEEGQVKDAGRVKLQRNDDLFVNTAPLRARFDKRWSLTPPHVKNAVVTHREIPLQAEALWTCVNPVVGTGTVDVWTWTPKHPVTPKPPTPPPKPPTPPPKPPTPPPLGHAGAVKELDHYDANGNLTKPFVPQGIYKFDFYLNNKPDGIFYNAPSNSYFDLDTFSPGGKGFNLNDHLTVCEEVNPDGTAVTPSIEGFWGATPVGFVYGKNNLNCVDGYMLPANMGVNGLRLMLKTINEIRDQKPPPPPPPPPTCEDTHTCDTGQKPPPPPPPPERKKRNSAPSIQSYYFNANNL